MAESTPVSLYNEHVKKYNQGINDIKEKEIEAKTQNEKGELSNSQLKKIKAQVYNELREYSKKTPRPRKPQYTNGKGLSTLATLMALSNGF